MPDAFDLTKLDGSSFEHLINSLAFRVLGAGHTTFGPGPDGGRDGFFEGEAIYPSEVDRWNGRWYIQSKFHKPHLSTDSQGWLLERISEEINAFAAPDSKRTWPDNWIIATNIEPSGAAQAGSHDKALELVATARPALAKHFHIWGGGKILDLLSQNPKVAEFYAHFLTPGHVFTALFSQIKDAAAELETILRYLIVRQFSDQQYTKLEQAGSDADTRPGIHRLFIDLPFQATRYDLTGMALEYLLTAANQCHRSPYLHLSAGEWRSWSRNPSRARVWFLKGGPGQGKSTLGQYFSQVHRASLILQDDCFPVVPNIRLLAEEVRDAATESGFWPASPRIPIAIELREYAQWFGQRTTDQGRGILTYLAERLTAGVEQTVSVGILKRALALRSWFVTFDGLDEVPHDVKDEVAAEVMHFVDDVVIETRSDTLALCTSRPQGYAGQFSDLDGPTVELVSLSPEQALSCAKPVLALGRSADEAKAYYQILKSATDSTSVRELMTTPLQAHIMAVVVRDGGKPPERRWQLYTNFYQVIKRREANRDLPDKRLARLLREDTQLLKTVHNRLGFALHARAETSEGAQTHLDRDEFRSLVEGAVSQMMEGDVEKTVEVLMEATIDRLVLVNTPDSGNHLRFDIRPLQEFFAAEFIYESVSAEDLRKRISFVAGDAHWLEVVHFLLSALVENNRHTELAVAVDVLETLDDGNGEPHARLLRRRTGRGALLAGRLLQEGVLEQDKRVRQQFRKSLEPLTGFVGFSAVHPYTSITQPNSRAWLINFLLESLREADRTENIGAATMLAWMVVDSDARTDGLQAFFLSSPSEYVSAIVSASVEHRFGPHSVKLTQWFAKVLLQWILRPEWRTLSPTAVRAISAILHDNFEMSMSIAAEMIPDNHLSLLRMLLEKDVEEIETKGPESKEHRVDYGFATAQRFARDWKTVEAESARPWVNADVMGAPGVLQLVARISHFATTRAASDFQSLLTYLGNDSDTMMAALPRCLRALVPIDRDHFGDVHSLKDIDASAWDALLTRGSVDGVFVPLPYAEISLGSEGTLEQWKELVQDAPFAAVQLASEHFWATRDRKRPLILDTADAMAALIDRIVELPVVAAAFPPLWGLLVGKSGPREEEVRRFLRRAASEPVIDTTYWGVSFQPFRLELPAEEELLPHLVNAVVNYCIKGVRRDVPGSLAEIRKTVNALVGSIETLERIVGSYRANNRVRAAAALLILLHPDGTDRLNQLHQQLIAFYFPEIGNWYLAAIRACVQLLSTESDPPARILVGGLLEVSRADYWGRIEIQGLLGRWRDTSQAPLQKSDAMTEWLGGKIASAIGA